MRSPLSQILLGIALVAATPIAPSAATAADPKADLSLTNIDSPDPVVAGATVTYAIEVRNSGPDAATDLAMTDNLPGATSVVSATPSAGSCDPKPRKVVCKLDGLALGEVWSISIAASVSKQKGSITNAASVQSAVPDPRPANNSQSQTTTIAPPPDPPDCEGVDGTVVGTEGDDTLTGTEHRDVFVALGGNDVVLALGGNDLICGSIGNDNLRGMGGTDVLRGAPGDDAIRGGDGGDDVGGSVGRDRLFGGSGPDRLRGGPGRDHCRGGFGHDVKQSC